MGRLWGHTAKRFWNIATRCSGKHNFQNLFTVCLHSLLIFWRQFFLICARFSPLGPHKKQLQAAARSFFAFFWNSLHRSDAFGKQLGTAAASCLSTILPSSSAICKLVASLWWLKLHRFPVGFSIFLKIGQLPAAPSSSQHPHTHTSQINLIGILHTSHIHLISARGEAPKRGCEANNRARS